MNIADVLGQMPLGAVEEAASGRAADAAFWAKM